MGEQQVCQSSACISVGLRLIKLVHIRTQVTSSVTLLLTRLSVRMRHIEMHGQWSCMHANSTASVHCDTSKLNMFLLACRNLFWAGWCCFHSLCGSVCAILLHLCECSKDSPQPNVWGCPEGTHQVL